MVNLPAAPLLRAPACRAPGVDPLWFFPSRGGAVERAKAICNGCAELERCRAFGLAAPPSLVGIWGALSSVERKRLRRSVATMSSVLDDVTEPVESELAEIELAEMDVIPTDTHSTNGNGHAPELVRSCGRCGKALSGIQEKWCSSTCRKSGPKKALVVARSTRTSPPRTSPQNGSQTELLELAHRFLALTGATELRFSTRELSATFQRREQL